MPESETRLPTEVVPGDPEAARRRAVALAVAQAAHHGGHFAEPRLRHALDVARGYAEGKAAFAELRSALGELGAAAEEARGRMAVQAFTLPEARRAGDTAEDYRAARAVADALGRAVGPEDCA